MQHLQVLGPCLLGRPRRQLPPHLRARQRQGKSLNAEVTECGHFVLL